MANEKLVSSVYFRGTKIGTGNLDVVDTSIPAVYQISYINNDGAAITNALDIQLGLSTGIVIRQNPYRADVPKIWYSVTGAGASKFNLYINTGNTKQPVTGEVAVPTHGTARLTLLVNYYPSLTNIDATIDLYHDAARTRKIASIPIRSKAVTGAKLTLASVRAQNYATEQEGIGIYNNDLLYIKYTDANVSRTTQTNIPFVTKINGVVINNGTYPVNGASWLTGSWTNEIWYGQGAFGAITTPRQKHPSVSGNVAIEITMGDLKVTNTLVDALASNLIDEFITFTGTDTFKVVTEPLPAGTPTVNDKRLSIGYAFVNSKTIGGNEINSANVNTVPRSTGNDYVTNLIINRAASLSILPKGMDRANNYLVTSKGKLTYLAWDLTKLDTVASRRQFGKYQKTLSAEWKWELVSGVPTRKLVWSDFTDNNNDYTFGFTLTKMQDSIATTLYGALTSLSFDTLAAFVFSSRDYSLRNNSFSFTGSIRLNGTNGYLHNANYFSPTLPAAIPANPKDLTLRTDVLFLRNNGSNEKNTFANDVPYPRIVNVQTAISNELARSTWEFFINPTLGIDLSDDRYTFITCIQSTYAYPQFTIQSQAIELVARSSNRILFRAGWSVSGVHLSVAIVDTGPSTTPATESFISLRAVLWPYANNAYYGYTALKDQTDSKGSYINQPLVLMNGRKFELLSMTTIGPTSAASPTEAEIVVRYVDVDGVEEAVTSKPATIYMFCEGITTPFELTRGSMLDFLTPVVTAAVQFYKLPTTTAGITAMASLALWMKNTTSAPKNVRFSLFK